MKKNKLFLGIIIIVVAILLVITGIFTYLELNGSPKKIFKNAISKCFDVVKEKQNNYKTVKEKIELSANIDSDDKEIKEIKNALENSKILLDVEVDLEDLFINGNTKVIYDDENFINANILVQDEKIYIGLKDWLDKYIEIPEDQYDLSEIKNNLERVNTINKKMLLDAVKEEVLNVISKQTFSKEKVKITLDKGLTSVTKSSLKLTNKQFRELLKEVLANLKNNTDFQAALGTNKSEVIKNIDNTLDNLNEEEIKESGTITFTIYTHGLSNQFVGFEFVVENDNEEEAGLSVIKKDQTKYECTMYVNKNEEKHNVLNAIWEANDKDGKITIVVPDGDKEIESVCNYKKNNNQIFYEIETETDQGKLNIHGSVTEEDSKYSGNAIISMEVPDAGKITLNCLYSIEYDKTLERVDVSNTSTPENLTEEEKEEFMKKIENSKLYSLVSKYSLLLDDAVQSAVNTADNLQSMNAFVTKDNYSVKYNVPNELTYINYSTEDAKTYTDENLSTIIVSVNKVNADEYLEELSTNYILTSPNYSNQNITEILDYKIGDKEFKYRGITYKDALGDYLKLCFTYKLSDDYTYIIDATIEGDSLSLDQITKFLQIEVSEDSEEFVNYSKKTEELF